MSGYSLILKIQALEKQLHDLGMRWGYDRVGGRWGDPESGDTVAVFPRGAELPIYVRDATLFRGTISQLEVWIQGVQWARDYDRMLRISDENKRKKGEARELERQALQRKREEQAQMIRVLKASDAENKKSKKGK